MTFLGSNPEPNKCDWSLFHSIRALQLPFNILNPDTTYPSLTVFVYKYYGGKILHLHHSETLGRSMTLDALKSIIYHRILVPNDLRPPSGVPVVAPEAPRFAKEFNALPDFDLFAHFPQSEAVRLFTPANTPDLFAICCAATADGWTSMMNLEVIWKNHDEGSVGF